MALIGYARVSTGDQDPALQTDALSKAGCENIFKDKSSGSKTSRPELDRARKYMRAGDVLVVWKLDRLGRSMHHLVEFINDLGQDGIGFRSLTEAIDTSTPTGQLLFHFLGALAQFEHDLIKERTRAGLNAAKKRGRVGGRPSVINDALIARVVQMQADGLSIREVSRALKIGKSTLYAALADREQQVSD